MLTVAAFLFALALLIAVHEYGHYRVAVACGVRVLRFSIGFGKPIWAWTSPRSGTEFALSAIPLGGYVKMLDGREAPVPEPERHLAFDTQPLKKRVAIVSAGPMANLFLAVILYAVVQIWGTQSPVPIIGTPAAGSIAEAVGLQSGDKVLAASIDGEVWQDIQSFDALRWFLTKSAIDAQQVFLKTERNENAASRTVGLDLRQIDNREVDAKLLRRIGLVAPWTKPVLGEVMPGGAAAEAGLQMGDLVLSVGASQINDGAQLRELIRASVGVGRGGTSVWTVLRGEHTLEIKVTTKQETVDGQAVGRIGAFVGIAPKMVTIQLGPLDALIHGAHQTWEISALTVRTLGRMLIGEASLKNLSGPVTIAEYAGKSAHLGLVPFLTFLALISVSLGVLNLLPLPVLDGGHLMYYLWEGLTGRAVTDAWAERLQRGGLAIMFLMMSVALYNDMSRLLG